MIQTRPIIKTLSPYVPGKPAEDVMREYGLSQVIKLASNENPYGCSPTVTTAVTEALKTPGLYPDGNATALRETLMQRLNQPANAFIFGSGSDELITMIAKTYIEPGDEAISAALTFPQYKAAVVSMDGIYIGVPNQDFGYDLDAMLGAITEKTKLIYIANPNNPTGTMLGQAAIEAFMAKVPASVLVVMDEAYNEYIQEAHFPNTLKLMQTYKNILLLRTFSKMYGLASFRVGYGVGDPAIIDALNRIRNPFNVSTYALVAAKAALEDTDFVQRCFLLNDQAKQYAYARCKDLGLSVVPSACNFVFVDCKKPANDLFVAMQKKGVIVRPIPHPLTPTFLRISLGTLEEMKQCFDTLERLLNPKESR